MICSYILYRGQCTGK